MRFFEALRLNVCFIFHTYLPEIKGIPHLKLNKIKILNHRYNFVISFQGTFFGDFFATGPVSPRFTTPPLQHVLEKPTFPEWHSSARCPLLGELSARFSADASNLLLDDVPKLCQVLRTTHHSSY